MTGPGIVDPSFGMPLTDRDLAFFARYEVDGVRIFSKKKVIQYQQARKVFKQGGSAEEAQAEYQKLDSRLKEWGGNVFEIEGELPLLK